jgi:hypothetical protein
MELAAAVELESGDAQHRAHALRDLLARRVETGMLAGLVESRDHRLQGVADAGDIFHAAFGDQLIERDGLSERFSAARP